MPREHLAGEGRFSYSDAAHQQEGRGRVGVRDAAPGREGALQRFGFGVGFLNSGGDFWVWGLGFHGSGYRV